MAPDTVSDDEHRPIYSVGQAAALLSTRHRFLHRLDRFEVVCPRRTPGGHRRYSEHEIGRIRRVMELAAEGATLAAIRRILSLERRVRELEAQVDVAWQRVVDLEGARSAWSSRPRRSSVPPL